MTCHAIINSCDLKQLGRIPFYSKHNFVNLLTHFFEEVAALLFGGTTE